MGIRVSGLSSGIDTDTLVEQLSSAYQVKIDNVKKKQKKVELQKDAWSTINSKILSFYKGNLSKLRYKGNYKSKSATVTSPNNKNLATVTTDTNATSGSYKVKILSTASSAYVTSAKLTSSDSKFTANYAATNSTTASQLKDADGNAVDLTGKTLTFKGTESVVKKDSDGNQLYSLKDASGNALTIDTYDADGNVTGTVNTADGATQAQIDAYLAKQKETLGDSYNADNYSQSELREDKAVDVTYTFTDSSSATDINTYLSDNGVTGIHVSMTTDGTMKLSNEAGYAKDADGNFSSAYGNYTVSGDAADVFGLSSDALNVTTDADGKVKTYTNGTNKFTYDVEGSTLSATSTVSQFLGDDIWSNAQTDSDGKKYISFSINTGATGSQTTNTVKIYEDTTVSGLATSMSEATGGKVSANYDAKNGRFFLTSAETGADNNFTLTADSSAGSNAALEKLGLVSSSLYTGDNAMSASEATNAKISVNGAIIDSDSNNVAISGLGITVNAIAADPDEELTVTVGSNKDDVKQMVKDFLTEYNNIVGVLAEYYYADSNDYEPLTDDEEAEMTDTQIEKWNNKVQEALLRRDSQVGSIMTNMRNELAKSFTVTNADGSTTKASLASLGIVTGEWTEYGVLHLQGDEDDGDYSSATDKLSAMLDSDPDKVADILSQAAQGLYSKLSDMMKTSTLSSTQTIYNDKQMKSTIEDYDDDIDDLQDKLTAMQDKYYSQFSRMEQAMSKLNSTASSLGFSGTSSS